MEMIISYSRDFVHKYKSIINFPLKKINKIKEINPINIQPINLLYKKVHDVSL